MSCSNQYIGTDFAPLTKRGKIRQPNVKRGVDFNMVKKSNVCSAQHHKQSNNEHILSTTI
jgi:hypothetical protein